MAGIPLLNTEQHLIFSMLNHTVDTNKSGLFFIDSPGGTGKIFLQNTVFAQQRLQNCMALVVATLDIAAMLLSGGTTAHSHFKIPIDVDEDSTCSIQKQSNLVELLQQTCLIFWDESVMCHHYAIKAVSCTLQDLCGTKDPRRQLPFGRIVVCFCNNFHQTLPVVKKGTYRQIISVSLKRSFL